MIDDTADPILEPALAHDPAPNAPSGGPSGPAPNAPSDPAPTAPSDPAPTAPSDPKADPTPPPDPAPTAPSDPKPTAPPDPKADPTPPRRARPTTGPVQYKGDDLEPERGPGLGCFRFQLAVLVVFIVLTPLTVAWDWPVTVSTVLLFTVIGLLLTTGQTIIFLLRLVAADRRGRRVPLAGGSRTVGELEDAETSAPSAAPETAGVAQVSGPASSERESASAAATDGGLDPDA